MPVQFPDGVYDHSHTWQNANDRVAYQRSFTMDPVEAAKITSALELASPQTPDAVIQAQMTVSGVPPTQGYDRSVLTVEDCFDPPPGEHVNDYSPSNFSGRIGEFQGSGLPSLPAW